MTMFEDWHIFPISLRKDNELEPINPALSGGWQLKDVHDTALNLHDKSRR